MPKFQFNKLVRDKVVENQINSGAKPTFRKLSLEEHKQALIHKIIEEANELREATLEEVISELADIQQVVDDLKSLHGVSTSQITETQLQKRNESGAFRRGFFIESVDLESQDPWVKYYREHAERYPEIS